MILNADNRPNRDDAAAASGGHGRRVDHGRGYKAAPAWRQEMHRHSGDAEHRTLARNRAPENLELQPLDSGFARFAGAPE
jgi:hypothetical protein